MEIVLLIAVLVILIVLFRNLTGVKDDLYSLHNELRDVKKLFDTKHPEETQKSQEKVTVFSDPNAFKPGIPVKEEIKKEELPEVFVGETKQERVLPAKPVETEIQRREIPTPAYVPASPNQNWFGKWLNDNPDIEKFIGENLINKIGISVLVLGIAFFVKYAIDQEWINKIGRVCIGLFCGVILIWFANRLKKNYHAFSSVLVGGGLAVFYFTIAFAFHQYHLISQGAAFGIMIVITIFAVLLSILYDRIELGILATVGGFITPFLVSQGDGNWFVLFSYLTILNAGLIVLAYYKRWRIINFIAFFFTQIIYLGWVISKTGLPGFNYQGIFIFGIIFYLIFLVMNVIHYVIRGSKLKAFDFIILLSANLCFYGAGMYLIHDSGVSQYEGLFTASLGIVNLILAYLFFRKSKADKKFIYLLIGITLTFISLAAPVQLRGNYITLFWSAEIVVLLWLYQRSFISLLKVTVLIVTALMLISLMMDWSAIYSDNPIIHPILFNKGCITGMFSAVSLYLVYRLLKKEADSYYVWGISNNLLRSIYLISSIILLFSAGAFEINDQFIKRIPVDGMQLIYLQLYLTVFVIALFFALDRFKVAVHPFLLIILPFIAFGMYIYNINNVHLIEKAVLFAGNYKTLFTGSWIGAILILLLVWYAVKYIQKNHEILAGALPHLTWILAVICVVVFSVEIGNLFVWLNYTDKSSFDQDDLIYDKAGLTIVWAVSSFTMIWMGMKYSYKPLRITALVLFGITLIKLFAFDIRDIAPGGKIIAFILLGILLLIISFMYQRLKKIIIDDSSRPI
jgi:uncharacterized membrane protein